MTPEWIEEVTRGIEEWFPDDPKFPNLTFTPAEIREILRGALAKPYWTLNITPNGLEISFGSMDLCAPAALGVTYLVDLIADLIQMESTFTGRVDWVTLAAAASEFEKYALQLRTAIRERGADLGGWEGR